MTGSIVRSRWAAAYARPSCGRAGRSSSVTFSGGFTDGLGNMRCSGTHDHIGQRAGEAPTERVTSDGGVQPDTSNDSIRFPGNLYNRQNQNDPRDYIEAAWYIRQDGKQHLKKDYIRHHQRTHTPEHPAPAPEYL